MYSWRSIGGIALRKIIAGVVLLTIQLAGCGGTSALKVVFTSPENGASGVPIDSVFVIEFNKAVDVNSLVRGYGWDTNIPHARVVINHGRIIQVFPGEGPLEENQQYILKFYRKLSSADGKHLERDYVFTFQTGTKAPSVDFDLPVTVANAAEIKTLYASIVADETGNYIFFSNGELVLSGTYQVPRRELFIPLSQFSLEEGYNLLRLEFMDKQGLKSIVQKSFIYDITPPEQVSDAVFLPAGYVEFTPVKDNLTPVSYLLYLSYKVSSTYVYTTQCAPVNVTTAGSVTYDVLEECNDLPPLFLQGMYGKITAVDTAGNMSDGNTFTVRFADRFALDVSGPVLDMAACGLRGDSLQDFAAVVSASGALYLDVWRGGSDGLGAPSPQTHPAAEIPLPAATVLKAKVTCGDVNGDGVKDVVVGLPGMSAGRGGLVFVPGQANTIPTGYAFTISGQASGSLLGYSVIIQDVNQDGHVDVVAGAPGDNNVYVYYGPVTAAKPSDTKILPPEGYRSMGLELLGLSDEIFNARAFAVSATAETSSRTEYLLFVDANFTGAIPDGEGGLVAPFIEIPGAGSFRAIATAGGFPEGKYYMPCASGVCPFYHAPVQLPAACSRVRLWQLGVVDIRSVQKEAIFYTCTYMGSQGFHVELNEISPRRKITPLINISEENWTQSFALESFASGNVSGDTRSEYFLSAGTHLFYYTPQ